MSKFLNTIIIILVLAIISIGVYLLFFNSEKSIKKIVLDKNEISIYIKDKNIITPSIMPDDAKDKTIIWTSSDEGVATVDEDGIIRAVNDGETTITASSKDGKVSATCLVKVFVREVKKIELSKSDLSLKIGEKGKITAKVLPSNATYPKLIFKSSDESIIKVDSSGNYQSIKGGIADIIVNDERGKVESRCHVDVSKTLVAVSDITIDKTSANMKVGEKLTITATISPSNASDKRVKWTSSDVSIATVDEDGVILAKKGGKVTITVKTLDGDKTISSNIVVKSNPIVPSTVMKKYESPTLKYYIQNNKSHYLTYIWMDDPYMQTKKLDAMTSFYNKIMTEEELEKNGKKPFRRTVGQMLTGYISNGMIPNSKAVIAFNASGFFVKGVWNPPSDYYHNRADGWMILNEGVLTRNRINDDKSPTKNMIGIDQNGNLKIYDGANTTEKKQQVLNLVMADKVRNTFVFAPKLVVNGKSVASDNGKAQRQAICQIDSNNYLMYTTISPTSFKGISDVFIKNNCITGFNLDGGGSTSMFYKDKNSKTVHKIKCSDSSNGTCRQVVEGIYFTEK